MTTSGRLDYGKTFVIGLGFLTTAVSWSLYNSYVPIFLKRSVGSAAVIGFIMTLDNWAAIVIQPWVGALSDRTRTRLGRRMPYIAAGIPVAAAFLVAIPLLASAGAGATTVLFPSVGGGIQVSGALLPLFLAIMGFNLAMALYRAPVVALMPDVTLSVHRSKANGVINLMGGVGSILAFLGGSFLYELGAPVPFAVSAGVMVLALCVLLAAVREPAVASVPTSGEVEEPRPAVFRSLRRIVAGKEYSALFILGAIFCWFFAYNGIETWFTTWGVDVLGVKENVASRMFTATAVAFVLFALPAGVVGTKLGRKRTILIGLGVFIADLVALIAIRQLALLWVLLAVAGVAWALINVNSITIVWELARGSSLGTYTGLYYFASALAQIVSPPLLGLLIDRAGMPALFPAAVAFMILAALLMLGVRRGESGGEAEAGDRREGRER
jgi:maltose/moltooligosaccharide transporter